MLKNRFNSYFCNAYFTISIRNQKLCDSIRVRAFLNAQHDMHIRSLKHVSDYFAASLNAYFNVFRCTKSRVLLANRLGTFGTHRIRFACGEHTIIQYVRGVFVIRRPRRVLFNYFLTSAAAFSRYTHHSPSFSLALSLFSSL